MAAVHIEDQVERKRCGHLDNKELISTKKMVNKIKECVKAKKDKNFKIIARSDAKGVEGIDKMIERCKAYIDAGAEIIFPEALKDKKYEKNAINHNKFWLKKMYSELSRLPVLVYDSRANFLLIKVGKSVKKLNQYLLSKSIIVRLMDKYNLPDCIRLSIGKSTENRKVLKAMKEFYNAK